jgi:hypothetical protein
MFANLMAVCRLIKKRSQDKHVQRSLQQIRSLFYLLFAMEDVRPSTKIDGRHSTIGCQERKVDSIVE